MDRWVHAQNLIRYVDLLEHEADPARRERFRELLLEEASRFGSAEERIIEVDGLVAAARVRVARQREVVVALARDDRETAPAEALLSTMEHTLALLLHYRGVLDGGEGAVEEARRGGAR